MGVGIGFGEGVGCGSGDGLGEGDGVGVGLCACGEAIAVMRASGSGQSAVTASTVPPASVTLMRHSTFLMTPFAVFFLRQFFMNRSGNESPSLCFSVRAA